MSRRLALVPILSRVDWPELLREIRLETKNRECYQPLVSVYRWWARRPHSLVRAVLEAAGALLEPNGVIADPFSGGGTVAIESARCSLKVYAQDVNPWAAWGLKVSLTPVDPAKLAAAGDVLLSNLRRQHGPAYGAGAELESQCHVHTFRVRTLTCGHCSKSVWMFPYELISLASRAKAEKFGMFGCRRCGSVTRRSLDLKEPRCWKCAGRFTPTHDRCPHCGKKMAIDRGLPPNWAVVLIQKRIRESDALNLAFSEPDNNILAILESIPKVKIPDALLQEIQCGIETAKLVRFGFKTWADLYPRRQLRVLISAGHEVMRMDVEEEIRNRLMLCVAGATEMAGHICRWDRFHPKIFEGLANHRYSFDGLAVEPNPLAPVGRGGLAHRIKASVTAARWLLEKVSPKPTVTYHKSLDKPRKAEKDLTRVTVALGSSNRLLLRKKTVSLILTDPPYYDCVQYGELSSLFRAWTAGLGIEERAGSFVHSNEAVPKGDSRVGETAYGSKLKMIFRECARVIKDDGRLILTYHGRSLRAWSALGRALAGAGFRVIALAVAETENSKDHSKRGKRSFITDLLIECVRDETHLKPRILSQPRTPEQRELLHVGLAMAEARKASYSSLRDSFLTRVARMRWRKISAPKPAMRKLPGKS